MGDDRVDNKRMREIRKEVLRLRTENKRLRKRLRFLEHQSSEDYQEDDEPADVEIVAAPKPTFSCPRCHSTNTNLFQLMERPYFRCNECGHKGRVLKK